MLKLPEKKYEPKHNNELKEYARGWNCCLDDAKDFCVIFNNDERIKEALLKYKRYYDLENYKSPFFGGAYDCVIEIERLNAEPEPEHRLDNFFQDSLEALDKLTIKSDDELDKKLEELNKYNEDSQLRML